MDAVIKDSVLRPRFAFVVLAVSLVVFGIVGAVFVEISQVVGRRRALVLSADALLEHAKRIAATHSVNPNVKEYLNALFQDSLQQSECVLYHIVLKDVDMVFVRAYDAGDYTPASDLYFVYARDDNAVLATLSFNRTVLERVRVATFVDFLLFGCLLSVLGVVAFPLCLRFAQRASLQQTLRRNSRFAQLVDMDDTLSTSLECSRAEAQLQRYRRSSRGCDRDVSW